MEDADRKPDHVASWLTSLIRFLTLSSRHRLQIRLRWLGRSLQKMAEISTVEGIERRFHELATRLGMKDTSGGFSTTPQHDGSPHIEQVGDEFHFVVTERGSEFERRRTRDPDDILYWLFEGFTQGMATDYELKNRDETRDGREIWFPYQERLLADLKPEWGVRKQQAHMRILREHPLHQNNQPGFKSEVQR